MRRRTPRGWPFAIAVAGGVHAMLWLAVPRVEESLDGRPPEPIMLTLVTPALPDPVPEPAPSPELNPEPEPPASPSAEVDREASVRSEPTPRKRDAPARRRRREAPAQVSEVDAGPPARAPVRFDLGRTGGGGVVVRAGQGEGTGQGTREGRGTREGQGRGEGAGRGEGTGQRQGDGRPESEGWMPADAVNVRHLPMPARVAELPCAATAHGVEGTVRLGVQVLRTGRVRKVRVLEAIGGGCDEVAARALRKATFKPAIGTDGRPVDFEVHYEYAFERTR